MDVFSRGFSDTPNLEELCIEIESATSYYVHNKDINATIQGFKAFVELHTSEVLNLTKLCDKDMFGYFVKEQAINITGFHRLLMLVPFNEIQMLEHVRALNVRHCDSLVEVFESVGEVTKKSDIAPIHYQLQKMTLCDLPGLSQIWKHNITEFVIFQNLRKIEVLYCHNLKSLLSHTMAKSLVQLKNLVVVNCKMMEEIITKGDELHIEGGNKVKTLYPKLEELRLVDLPMLECVCSGDYDYDIPLCTVEEEAEFNNNDKDQIQISFPELKELNLREVPKLKCFCSGVYNYNINLLSTEVHPNMRTFPCGNVIVELQKLETFRDVDEELLGYIKRVTDLDIVNCHKLLNCIPSYMMHLFLHLKLLTVERCDFVAEIFESNDSMLLCELDTLDLYSLPKLKHIWKNHGKISRFECLQHIMINKCNDLEHVFPDVSMLTSLPNLRYLYVDECEKMKEIIGNNSCVQHNAKIKFPNLKTISLKKLPSLKCFGRSSFPCYVEMPHCGYIFIEDCPEMKTFWYDGTLYTPRFEYIFMDKTIFDRDEDVNEVIQGRK